MMKFKVIQELYEIIERAPYSKTAHNMLTELLFVSCSESFAVNGAPFYRFYTRGHVLAKGDGKFEFVEYDGE